MLSSTLPFTPSILAQPPAQQSQPRRRVSLTPAKASGSQSPTQAHPTPSAPWRRFPLHPRSPSPLSTIEEDPRSTRADGDSSSRLAALEGVQVSPSTCRGLVGHASLAPLRIIPSAPSLTTLQHEDALDGSLFRQRGSTVPGLPGMRPESHRVVRTRSNSAVLKPALKATRSMPASPRVSAAKYVHFDAKLEHIKFFLRAETPRTISTTASDDEDDGNGSDSEAEEEPPSGKRPAVSFVFKNRPHLVGSSLAVPVRCESIDLVEADGDMHLYGEVRVQNLEYHKRVTVRYTLDFWQSVTETDATHKEMLMRADGRHAGIDQFSFRVPLQAHVTKFMEGSACQDKLDVYVAIRYQVTGREFWDNNDGQNYQMQIALSKPGRHSSKSAAKQRKPKNDDVLARFVDLSLVPIEPLPSSHTFPSSRAADRGEHAFGGSTGTPQALADRYSFSASLSAAINRIESESRLERWEAFQKSVASAKPAATRDAAPHFELRGAGPWHLLSNSNDHSPTSSPTIGTVHQATPRFDFRAYRAPTKDGNGRPHQDALSDDCDLSSFYPMEEYVPAATTYEPKSSHTMPGLLSPSSYSPLISSDKSTPLASPLSPSTPCRILG